MEYIVNLFHALTGNQFSTGFILSIIIGIAFTLIFGAIFIVFYHFTDPLQKRKSQFLGKKEKSNGQVKLFAHVMGPVASKLYLSKETAELSKIKQKLLHAGYDNDDAPVIFYSAKIVFALGFFFLIIFLAGFFPQYTANQVGIAAFIAGFVGLVLPDKHLDYKYTKRKKELMNGFPDALDLMVTCTEAGLGLNQTFNRVSEEILISHPSLAKELAIVNAKIRAGVDRMQALRELATRTGLDEIQGMVTLLNQSIQFGTSIADMLRIFAEEFRDRRMQKAEERAAQIGTKLIFPLVLCMFPAFFIVAIGPAILKVLKVFGKV
jgi:tight adherence protein C